MMRLIRTSLAWSLRVVGWGVIIAFLVYVACNVRGIGVRGRLARSWRTENDNAVIQSLARHAGFEDETRGQTQLAAIHITGCSGLFGPLKRQHSAITFAPDAYASNVGELPPEWPRTAVFDPDGLLIGVMQGPPERGEAYSYVTTQVVGVGGRALLFVTYHPKWHQPYLYDIYLVDPAGGRLVLSLRLSVEFFYERVLRDVHDRVVLHFDLRFGHHETVGQSSLDFTWDDSNDAFTLPAPHPKDWWKVLFPPRDDSGHDRRPEKGDPKCTQ